MKDRLFDDIFFEDFVTTNWSADSETPPDFDTDYDKSCTHTLAYREGSEYKCSYCGELLCVHSKVKIVPMIFSAFKICLDCNADLGKVDK